MVFSVFGFAALQEHFMNMVPKICAYSTSSALQLDWWEWIEFQVTSRQFLKKKKEIQFSRLLGQLNWVLWYLCVWSELLSAIRFLPTLWKRWIVRDDTSWSLFSSFCELVWLHLLWTWGCLPVNTRRVSTQHTEASSCKLPSSGGERIRPRGVEKYHPGLSKPPPTRWNPTRSGVMDVFLLRNVRSWRWSRGQWPQPQQHLLLEWLLMAPTQRI